MTIKYSFSYYPPLYIILLFSSLSFSSLSQADIILEGDNAGIPNQDQTLTIGTANSNGSLIINNGSTVTANEAFLIGQSPNGVGITTVTDNGSQLTVGGTEFSGFAIGEADHSGGGNFGTGTLNISNNAVVTFKDEAEADSFISFNVGSDSNGTLNINSGAKLQILDENAMAADFAVRIGRHPGGIGRVTISGPGSQLLMQGRGPFFDIGRQEGDGSVTVEDGASLDIMGVSDNNVVLTVGREGGKGTLSFNNASALIDSNFFSQLRIGRNDGEGMLTATNSQITVRTTGMLWSNGDAGVANIFVGRNNPNAPNAKLILDNAQVTVEGGPFPRLFIADEGGKGEVEINNGSTLLIQNSTDPDNTTDNEGSGVQISGNFSRTGILGILTIDGANSRLEVSDTNGAFVNAGSNQGQGILNIRNGGHLEIASTNDFAALQIGQNGSTGEVNLDNATVTLRVAAGISEGAFLIVGRDGGNGTLNINNNSRLELIDPDNESSAVIGRTVDSTGLVKVTGANALLDANSLLGIGVDFELNDAGTGSLQLFDNGQVNAAETVIGTNGSLLGNGTVNGNVTLNGGLVSGDTNATKSLNTKAEGERLRINGNYIQGSGVTEVRLDEDGDSDIAVTGTADLMGGTLSIMLPDDFAASADPISPFAGGGAVMIRSGLTVQIVSEGNREFEADINPDGTITIVPVIPIPTLSQWAMLILFGLLVLSGIWATKRRQPIGLA